MKNNDRQPQRYAAQSKKAARGALQLAIFLLIAAVLLRTIWGIRGPLVFAGSAFFFLIAAVEIMNMRFLRRKDKKETAAAKPKLRPGELGEFSWRGEAGFGTILELGGRIVHLDLRRDELLEERKRVALELIANADRVNASFTSFKRDQASSHPEDPETILGLEIDLILFHTRDDPAFGEVYFTTESGSDLWFCAMKNGEFFDLVQES